MWKRTGTRSLRLPATGVACGDRVEVRLSADFAIVGALVTYGMPLAGLLAGAAAAAVVNPGDLSVLIGAVGGCGLAYAATRSLRRRLEVLVLRHVELRPAAQDRC